MKQFNQKEYEEKRRAKRHHALNDQIDPFFVYKELLDSNKINTDYNDKFLIKTLLKGIVRFPKTLFTFDIDGNILTKFSEFSKGQEILIKFNKSFYGASVRKIKVGTNLKHDLSLFAKEQLKVSKKLLSERSNSGYENMKPVFFAEEILPFVQKEGEVKVFTFDKVRFYSFVRGMKLRGKTWWTWRENREFNLDHNAITPMIWPNRQKNYKMTDREKEVQRLLQPIITKIYKKIGHFARIDFYVSKENDVYLGEVTPMPSLFQWFEGGKVEKKVSSEYVNYIVKMWKGTYK